MHVRRFGSGERDLVLILGWGNQFRHETVQWLVERVVDAGYRVHGFQIPTTVTDFERDWLQPVASTIADLEEYRLLTHSTGGLVGEFLEGPETKVHLSPWWGFHDDLDTPVVDWAMKLPVATPVLPASTDRAALGELVTDERLADSPKRAAPTFLREAKRGQHRLPPFDADTTSVFYTPTDAVVSAEAIEARTPPENLVAYEGGHELFASPSRAEHIDTVLAALDEGPDAL
ncbi:alpha/beta hydrolase [Halomarina oriensis]|uniref:Alpha/beta hydrolase n=1 Tax=Halomarina oriensis TaxID=671145 RepID=A0A6B0GKP2_9EURY|nr:alpha/beta hydrolase [Halomarina oriensis]MWG35314.1 alpha/beta hydrolase [Halomarina oriensis]